MEPLNDNFRAVEEALAAKPIKFLPVVHQITAPTTSLAVTIPGGVSPTSDDLVWVFLDGHQLMEGQDYTRAADGQSITFTSPIQPASDEAPAREVAIMSQKQTVVGSGEEPADILLQTIQSIGQPGGLATLNDTGKLVQMPTAADVGARPNTWMPTAADVGAAACEYGRWTPYLKGGNSDPACTYGDRFGEYIRIGDLVVATFLMNISSINGGGGFAKIGGLPIALPTGYASRLFNVTYKGETGVTVKQRGAIDNGTRSVILIYDGQDDRLSISNIAAGFYCYGTLTYILRDDI